MVQTVVRAICEMTDKLGELILELRGGSGKGITSSIYAVARQGDKPIRLVSQNERRLGVVVHNDSGGDLIIALDGDRCDDMHYSFKLEPKETLHFDMRMFKELYKGHITGYWLVGTGLLDNSKAMVTEVSYTN